MAECAKEFFVIRHAVVCFLLVDRRENYYGCVVKNNTEMRIFLCSSSLFTILTILAGRESAAL